MQVIFTLLCSFLFVACVSPRQQPPAFDVATTKPDTRVSIEWKEDTAYFDIMSESGIDSTRVRVTAGDVPNKIVLRLRLKGLESLKFAYATNEIQVSVSSSGEHSVSENARLNNATQEQELSSASEFWMPTEIVSQATTIPLQDGYFQIELPRAFYASDVREFSIEWIDFYR